MKRPREDPGWVRCVLPAIPSQQLPAKVSYLPPHGLQRYKRPPPKVKRLLKFVAQDGGDSGWGTGTVVSKAKTSHSSAPEVGMP